MFRKYILFAIALLLSLSVAAQRSRQKTTPKKKPVVEEPQEDPRITTMREATQQIVFVDSIVVDKQKFLSQYRLSSESGRLMTYTDFFHSDEQPYAICYLNELGNKAWFSKSGKLYTTDLLGGKEWNTPTLLDGLEGGQFSPANYPYMMADGTTFYFAAGGSESIGGLDIFVTRYDSNTGRFLVPENIGMPFNSEANDYMIAIDEMNNIGYFASDRRQPEGKVCIYTFIPNKTRRTYDADALEEQVLRSLADIHSIADTWGDGKARKEALNRLQALRTAQKVSAPPKQTGEAISFMVDDQTTYHTLADFLVLDNRTRYQKLQQTEKNLRQLAATLDALRQQYAANKDKVIPNDILQAEKEYYSLQRSVRQLEKDIRNTEIKARQ